MEIGLHAGATADLTEAGDRYESEQPGLGAEFREEVDAALVAIAEGPRLWQAWPGAPTSFEIRRFVLTRFPYVLVYFIEGERITVLAVAHSKRRPGYWRKRIRRT